MSEYTDSSYWIGKALQYEADLDVTRQRLHKLEVFYKAVARLTLNHDVVNSTDGNEYASVAPSKLGPLLETIDPEWWRNTEAQ